MRLSRNTLLLIAALAAVIVIMLVVSNNQVSAPAADTTPTAVVGGPLFGDLAARPVLITQLVLRDNATGATQRYGRDADNLWGLEDGRPIAADSVLTAINDLAGLNANDTFESDSLAQFGLDHPAYTVFITTSDDTAFALHIGGKNPNGARYYVTTQTLTTADVPTPAPAAESTLEAESTAEATALPEPLVTLDGTIMVSTVPKAFVEDTLLPLLTAPPLATPTLPPTTEPTAEPTVEPTEALVSTPAATPAAEATAEATAAP